MLKEHLDAIPNLPEVDAAETLNRLQQINKYRLPGSVNSLAQLAISYICDHSALIRSFISETRVYIADQRRQFQRVVC